MHRRTAPSAAAASLKVAASRERRERRKIQNGLNRSASMPSNNLRYGQRILVISVSLIVVILLLLWIGAMFHLSSTTHSDLGQKITPDAAVRNMKLMSVMKPNNNKNNNNNKPHIRIHSSRENPYTTMALAKNPYLGWQLRLYLLRLDHLFLGENVSRQMPNLMVLINQKDVEKIQMNLVKLPRWKRIGFPM